MKETTIIDSSQSPDNRTPPSCCASSRHSCKKWPWPALGVVTLVLLAVASYVWARKSLTAANTELARQGITRTVASIQHSWQSGKLLAGQGALALLRTHLNEDPALFSSMETALVEAGHDPDFDARELALSILRQKQHAAWLALAVEQLSDIDPELRLLGLNELAEAGSAKQTAWVAPLLDDKEARVSLAAAATLRRWVGAGELPPETEAGLPRSEVQRWHEWWGAHAKQFSPTEISHPEVKPRLVSMNDFTLEDWRGQVVRLSDFKERVVLLHLFDPEITNSWSDLPALASLQRRHEGKLVVVGLATDTEALGSCKHATGTPCPKCARAAAGKPPVDVPHVSSRIEELVSQYQIKHPIAVDPTGGTWGRFAGGGVPVCVVIDREGHVWRRFRGNRTPGAWEDIATEVLQGEEPHIRAFAAHRRSTGVAVSASGR